MCFDIDSAPPIPVIAGAAVSHELLKLRAADGNELAAFLATPDEPGADRGRDPARRARALPLLRGARASLRRARPRCARDRLLRTHGRRRRRATTTSSTGRTSTRRPTTACRPTRARRSSSCAGSAARSVFTVGFCFGGRASWVAAASGHGLAGVGRLLRLADRASGAGRAPSQRVGADRVPDPRPAGGRRPGHHGRGQRGVRAALTTPASSTRSSSTTARRTASSTASRRSSRTRPTTPGAARSRSSTRTRDPRDRPGHDRDDLPRRRRRAAACSGAATASCRSTSRGRAGSSTTPRRSGTSVARGGRGGARRPRASRAADLDGDRDHEPARDDAALGARDRARPVGAGDRLAGPAHRRALPRARRRS